MSCDSKLNVQNRQIERQKVDSYLLGAGGTGEWVGMGFLSGVMEML